jgi:hypothetical protein
VPQMSKRELTKLFLEQAGMIADDSTVKLYLPVWWGSPLSPIGLRLTSHGAGFLSHTLKLQKYSYNLKQDFQRSLKVMLQMNKYLTSPFYIQSTAPGKQIITFFGEYDAVMMGMMDGDLCQYLENFTRD